MLRYRGEGGGWHGAGGEDPGETLWSTIVFSTVIVNKVF